MYLELLFKNTLSKFLNPKEVYVGILKYLPVAKLNFHFLSSDIISESASLGDIFSKILFSCVKLSWSNLTPKDTPSLSSINVLFDFRNRPYFIKSILVL